MARLCILAGVAGSGKSTLAPLVLDKCAQKGLLLCPLDPDVMYGPMERALLTLAGSAPDDRDSEVFKLLARPARYEGLWQCAKFILDSGRDVMLIAPFSAEAKAGLLLQTAVSRVGRQHQVDAVWIYASEARRKQRVIERNRKEDAVKLANWDEYEKKLPKPEHIKGIPLVENEADIEKTADDVMCAWSLKNSFSGNE